MPRRRSLHATRWDSIRSPGDQDKWSRLPMQAFPTITISTIIAVRSHRAGVVRFESPGYFPLVLLSMKQAQPCGTGLDSVLFCGGASADVSPSLDIPELPDLEADLRALIAAIPAGKLTTCGMLAEALGDRAAAVWIGRWLQEHAHHDSCHCHRVVRVGGVVGGYARDAAFKLARLRAEGALLPDGSWNPEALLPREVLHSVLPSPPLAELRRWQEEVRRAVRLQPLANPPEYLGGVDASYGVRGEAVAAYCHVRRSDGQLLESIVVRQPCRFPYISGYLAFRELPVMLAAVSAARRAGLRPDLLLVDGAGVLHPRRAGLASHLGVLLGTPTVGVTKKLLCGTLPQGEPQLPGAASPIVLDGETMGVCLRSQSGHARCVYVSPGHLVDVTDGATWTAACFPRRLPETIYWADRISRQASRRPG